MKTIQPMPDIWDREVFITSRKAVLGALADCAIQQSPYLCPSDLVAGLYEFDREFTSVNFFVVSCAGLEMKIRNTIVSCPIIRGWGTPKRSRLLSVISDKNPDFNFISLDALARNVAHSVTLKEKYERLHE